MTCVTQHLLEEHTVLFGHQNIEGCFFYYLFHILKYISCTENCYINRLFFENISYSGHG